MQLEYCERVFSLRCIVQRCNFATSLNSKKQFSRCYYYFANGIAKYKGIEDMVTIVYEWKYVQRQVSVAECCVKISCSNRRQSSGSIPAFVSFLSTTETTTRQQFLPHLDAQFFGFENQNLMKSKTSDKCSKLAFRCRKIAEFIFMASKKFESDFMFTVSPS